MRLVFSGVRLRTELQEPQTRNGMETTDKQGCKCGPACSMGRNRTVHLCEPGAQTVSADGTARNCPSRRELQDRQPVRAFGDVRPVERLHTVRSDVRLHKSLNTGNYGQGSVLAQGMHTFSAERRKELFDKRRK